MFGESVDLMQEHGLDFAVQPVISRGMGDPRPRTASNPKLHGTLGQPHLVIASPASAEKCGAAEQSIQNMQAHQQHGYLLEQTPSLQCIGPCGVPFLIQDLSNCYNITSCIRAIFQIVAVSLKDLTVMVSSLVPDYEVKVLLKPSEVLGSDNKLKPEVLSAFSIPKSTKKMNIQFVDTNKQDIYNSGWNLRIRKTEGEDGFELTYKKRYPVGEGYSSTAEGHIDAAAKTAEKEGFDSTTAYDAQVEVGYVKQTLSISHDETTSDKGFDEIDLPLAEDSRKFLAKNPPKEFKNWTANNWGTDRLKEARVYGPVLAKRSKGTWDEFKLYIEVWPIRVSKDDATLVPIVEASFKTPDFKKALEGHAKLIKFVQDKGWFLAEDSLKTKLIMERY